MDTSNPFPAHPPERLAAHARLVAGVVGYATGASLARILAGPRGRANVASARQLAMYLLHGVFAASLAHVAVIFARDRSTVTHNLRLIEERREDAAYNDWVESLEDMLRSAPAPKRVSAALGALPRSLAAAVTAFCIEETGIEALERARRWPARSGKVVLKLALEMLADHFGFA